MSKNTQLQLEKPDALKIYSTMYNSFIFVGVILSIVSIFVRGSSGTIVKITAYASLSAGLLLILGSLLSNLSGKIKTVNDLLTLIKLNVGPFFLIGITIIYLLIITILNKDRINKEHVSDNYYLFSTFTVILICIQMSLVFNGMSKSIFKETGMLPLSISTFIYLIGIINVVIALTIGIILKYYVTDG